MTARPVEAKVTAAAVASAVSAFIAWVLRTYAFHGDLPAEVEVLIDVVVVAAATFAAGYGARHTPRPDLGEGSPGRHERPDS